jgi:TRAP-type C4-dicarboxylate transport system substrate-binding protein
LHRLPSAILALLLLGASAGAQTLKIATVVPEGSSWLAEMRKAGGEIAARTQGRVRLKFYPGGVMGDQETVLRKMGAGQPMAGPSRAAPWRIPMPISTAFPCCSAYGGRPRAQAWTRASARGLARKGFEALAIGDTGFAYLMSQQPIREVGDLEGAKVWIPEDDVMSRIAFERAGVSPVPLAISDVYTALQTHLVDTVAAPPMATIAFQWHAKLEYLTDVPLMYLFGILALDRKAFAELSPGDQAILRETVAASAARLDAESRAGEESAKAALRNQGIEFVTASSEQEIQRWHDISAETLVKLRGTGRYSEAAISEILRLVEEYRAAQPEPR